MQYYAHTPVSGIARLIGSGNCGRVCVLVVSENATDMIHIVNLWSSALIMRGNYGKGILLRANSADALTG